jgi:hypothetical protein
MQYGIILHGKETNGLETLDSSFSDRIRLNVEDRWINKNNVPGRSNSGRKKGDEKASLTVQMHHGDEM